MLRGVSASHTAAAVGGDAAGQDVLNSALLKGGEEGRGNLNILQSSEEMHPLLSFLGQVSVCYCLHVISSTFPP